MYIDIHVLEELNLFYIEGLSDLRFDCIDCQTGFSPGRQETQEPFRIQILSVSHPIFVFRLQFTMDTSALSDCGGAPPKGFFAEKFIDILKETGFDEPPTPEEIIWMEDIDNVGPFLSIFSSLTSDNFLHRDEVSLLNSMAHLESDETVEAELEKYLGPLDNRQSPWMDSNISMLEEEILSLKREISQAEHVNNALDLEIKQKELSITNSSQKLSEVKQTVKTYQDKCSTLHNKFNDTCKQFVEDYAIYNSSLRLQSKKEPVVRLTQLTFEEFNENNVAISREINENLLKKFNQKNNLENEIGTKKMAQMFYLRIKELEISKAELNMQKSLLKTEKFILENCFEKNNFPSFEELRNVNHSAKNNSLLLNDEYLYKINEYSIELVKNILMKYYVELLNEFENETSTLKNIIKTIKDFKYICEIGWSFVCRESKIGLISVQLLQETINYIEKFCHWFQLSKVEIKQKNKMEWRKSLISCWDLLDGSPRNVHLEDVFDSLKSLADDIYSYKGKILKSIDDKQNIFDSSIVKLRIALRNKLLNWEKHLSMLELNEEFKTLKLRLSISNEVNVTDYECVDQTFKDTVLFSLTSPITFVTKILQIEEEEKLLQERYLNYLKDTHNINL